MPFEKLAKKYVYVPQWKKTARKVRHIAKKILGGEKTRITKYSHEEYGLKYVFKK
jgi:hypothetical protein